MKESVSFDQAADYYDQTRGLPDRTMDQLVPMLARELPSEGSCLEIGIGTGRIALPLIALGIDVVGVDISVEMLRKLLAKSSAKIAIADATRLPFRDRTFGAAIASHVLHLIPEWRTALDEISRVVAPGGVVLASRSAGTLSTWHHAVRLHFFDFAGNPPWPPGLDRMEELDVEMRSRGAAVRSLPDVRNDTSVSIAELIQAMEKGVWAACWSIDEEVRRRAADETRTWAAGEFGDLDLKRPTRHDSDWRAYRLAE